MYTATQIAQILGSDPSLLVNKDAHVTRLSMDTRKIESPEETLFFALSGSMLDGYQFIQDAMDKGIKNIVAEKSPGLVNSQVNLFIVPDSLAALQKLATYHRNAYKDIEVVGITGSNGKTTIKEWLGQMIHDRQIVKNPKSYNSQTGVPLSVWQIKDGDQLAIFEAGISQPNEMSKLADIIHPTIGLFTMIGDAHAAGFTSMAQKLNEKLNLFSGAETIIFEEDDLIVSMAIRERFHDKKLLSWGKSADASLYRIIDIQRSNYQTLVRILYVEQEYSLVIPFSDSASIENVLHCTALMIHLGIPISDIGESIMKLQNIPMRLEMKNGMHHSILINDTYNADLQSFKIALEFLSQQSGVREKMLILSDFMQTGLEPNELNHQIANLIHTHQIAQVIGVGSQVKLLEKFLDPFILFTYYENTEAVIIGLTAKEIENKAILVKGARVFHLEKLIHALSDKAHSATLETDMQAIEHNMKVFTDQLSRNTQIIAVIKASAYGSGSEELARFLEFKKVGYLAVAFIDEGIQLRRSGVVLPIIILNPDRNGVPDMIKYDLEPEVYSIDQLVEIMSIVALDKNKFFNVHIKLDTGMHRLGLGKEDIAELTDLLVQNKHIRVKSIFSHLSSSEDPSDDDYTHAQVQVLNESYDRITAIIGYKPSKHILNSAGIIRFPQYHFDLVRLGLGLYGIDSTGMISGKLEKAHTLKATVVQVKNIAASEYVGYNRKWVASSDGRIAIINIGYADGLMRLAGNGKYTVNIRGQEYAIIGNVCMDLSIIDIDQAMDIAVGDEVIIFGKTKPVEKLAEVCQTIPYEILSRISSRVRRLYVQG